MNTLQEAARNAIKLLEELRGISYLKYEHTAIENSAKELRTALAQRGEPAQASGRTNPGDETGGAVERFGWQTFLGKSPEIVPATNGSFVWYSDYLKLWQSAQPIGINGMVEATTRPAIDAAIKQGVQHDHHD